MPYTNHFQSVLITVHVGLTAFLVIRMWFGKAVEDFNRAITEGQSTAQLIANTSNGFTSAYSSNSLSDLLADPQFFARSGLGRLRVLRRPVDLCSCQASRHCFRRQISFLALDSTYDSSFMTITPDNDQTLYMDFSIHIISLHRTIAYVHFFPSLFFSCLIPTVANIASRPCIPYL